MRITVERVLAKTRVCRTCNVEKPRSEFSPDYRSYHQIQTQCKACKRAWMKQDRINRPETYKHRDLNMYGLTIEKYKTLLKLQGGVCAICKGKEKTKRGYLHVDHNHETGKVRGLLCQNCNKGIGLFKEKESNLFWAIFYLRGHK